MFGIFSSFSRLNPLSLTPVVRTALTKIPLLGVNSPVVEQVAHRSNRIYVPDWSIPFRICGPRARNYKANVFKRIAAHGLETRLKTRGGKQILWRKILKGADSKLVVGP